ncbi:MAG: class I SAM-dependent methyltransferase [Candidatus Thorarchaeota archaeon]
MKRTGVSEKFNEFIALAIKENKISFMNLKLLLKSLYFSFRSYIRRERNIASEVYNYESLFFIKKKDPIAFLESCRKNPSAIAPEIRDEVIKLKEKFKVNILRTLEIGSGPNSNLSYWVDKKLINVIAIDPLADIYKKMMKKLNYTYPIVPIKLKGEELLKVFKKESFHIIFAQNSLDHAENPLKCFKNGYKLLKKGGFFFVCSNIKEGSRKSWTGMHKFDIYVENNELFLENQKGEVFKFIDNNDISMDFIFYEEYHKWNVPSFEAVFRKIR